AATEPVVVEDKLFDLLSLAADLTRETEGAFDISVGALIKAWGFYRRRGQVPAPEEQAEVRQRIGMHLVALDPERRAVSYGCPGLEINLGSIGKGYALDRVVELLKAWSVRGGLVHGGRSSVFALGNEPDSRRGWSIGLADPANPERRLAVLRL